MSPTYDTVARFTDLTQAQAARSVLESAGLSPQLRDEFMGSLNWLYVPALGGLRLEVTHERAEEARQLLGELPELEGEGLLEDGPATDREASARRKRRVALVALVILFLPPILVLLFF